MYLDHYGLRELPFTLTPNTRFFIDSAGHHQALTLIRQALGSGAGFIKVTGEVGTGKTLLCSRLLTTLGDEVVAVYVANPCLSPGGLLPALAEELELSLAPETSHHHLLNQLKAKLAQIRASGRKVLFLLDNMQALPEDNVEALHVLTSLETGPDQQLQVVLFGQPELNDLLSRHTLRPLKQRITFSCVLPALGRKDLAGYIDARLALAGYSGPPLFTAKALALLFRASGGVPLVLNQLCHQALLVTCGKGERQVTAPHVNLAIADSSEFRVNHQFRQLRDKNRSLWAAFMVACVAVSGVALYGSGYLSL